MIAKIDINALKIQEQMRLKIHKNYEQPASTQNTGSFRKRVQSKFYFNRQMPIA